MDLLSLHQLFLDAGLKINGINSDGVISWIGTPAEKDIQAANKIITDNPISETDVAPIASVHAKCPGDADVGTVTLFYNSTTQGYHYFQSQETSTSGTKTFYGSYYYCFIGTIFC